MSLLNYYIEWTAAQLPHILPIAEKLGGTIYTNCSYVETWLKRYSMIPCIRDTPPIETNLVLADYVNFPQNNTIQVCHGVSTKTYINEMPREWFKYIINPSPTFKLNTSLTGFTRFRRYHKNSFIPGTCLYCPTLKLSNLDFLKNLLKKYQVTFKPHPSDWSMSPLIQEAISLGAILVDPLSEENIRYERLFETAEVLASDTSSMLYEFSLTGRKVITPDMNETFIDYRDWFYTNDICEEIEKCLI